MRLLLGVATFGFAFGCTGARVPEPTPAIAPKSEPRSAAKPKPNAPKPLPTEVIQFQQQSEFVSLDLGEPETPLLSEREIIKLLPAPARAQYTAELRVKTEDEASSVRLRSAEAFERQLEKNGAFPVLGLAASRLRARNDALSPSVAPMSFDYDVRPGAEPGEDLAPLRRAAELSKLDDEVGRKIQLELIERSRRTNRATEAQRLIDQLLPAAPAEWRSELHFRAGLLHALSGDHAGAAERFEQALRAHVPGSTVPRVILAGGVLAARYRAEQFDEAIEAGLRVFDEHAKRKKHETKPSAEEQLAELNARLTGMEQDAVERLVADAIERTNRDPTSLGGRSKARAAILSRLAVRALYRNDLALARRYAEAARALGKTGEARVALSVLEALARRKGDALGAEQLAAERAALPKRKPFGRLVVDRREIEPDETAIHPQQPEQNEVAAAMVTRNLRSLLRVCLEPVHSRLPAALDFEHPIALLEFSAKVVPDGSASVTAKFDRADPSLDRAAACLRELGPRVFAHAPSGTYAKVALADSVRGPRWSEITQEQKDWADAVIKTQAKPK